VVNHLLCSSLRTALSFYPTTLFLRFPVCAHRAGNLTFWTYLVFVREYTAVPPLSPIRRSIGNASRKRPANVSEKPIERIKLLNPPPPVSRDNVITERKTYEYKKHDVRVSPYTRARRVVKNNCRAELSDLHTCTRTRIHQRDETWRRAHHGMLHVIINTGSSYAERSGNHLGAHINNMYHHYRAD